MDLLVIAPDLVGLARVVLSAASRDDVTPVICAGGLSVTADGRLQAVATDRYRIVRSSIPAYRRNKTDGKLTATTLGPKSLPEERVIVSRETWAWIAKNGLAYAKSLNGGTITLQFEAAKKRTDLNTLPGAVVVRVAPEGFIPGDTYLETRFPTILGNFPPVERLLDDAIAAEQDRTNQLTFRPEFLSTIEAAVGKSTPVTLKPTIGREAAPLREGEPPTYKPGPLYWRTVANFGSLVEGAIQPHLNLR